MNEGFWYMEKAEIRWALSLFLKQFEVVLSFFEVVPTICELESISNLSQYVGK